MCLDICYIPKYFTGPDDSFLVRIFSSALVNVCYKTKEDFLLSVERLKNDIDSIVFCYKNLYLAHSSKDSSKFLKALSVDASDECVPLVDVLFQYDLRVDDHTPFIEIECMRNKLHKHGIPVDALCCIKRTTAEDGLHSVLCSAFRDFLTSYSKACLFYRSSSNTHVHRCAVHNYLSGEKAFAVFYPQNVSEDRESEWRITIHSKLGLPSDVPLVRRGQALLPIPSLAKWLGPNNEMFVNPHEGLKRPPGESTTYVVMGRYTYKHYLQDGIDDKNWGCAYRSLQTLISWLMWQGEIECKSLPSLTDIQASLVRVGDKPQRFIGSRQWIGSLEVSFCLGEMYGIQCRLVPVARGSEMATVAAPLLAQHFASGGGPVMIGGGQLAHTIIGVHLANQDDRSVEKRSDARYLILDPHFTGPANSLKTILEKGWCGWKDSSFWKDNVHYNLCFLPPIVPGRV
ncbi:unnamed protein product [Calicophoron daubneyi]|uniref:Ufm1-specific protease 2 n=1 Tax=Calicophoron daubneyi TaxID=300641 RepID=A0AAV2U0E8_CALDB